MTEQEIAKLERLERAATPRPWEHDAAGALAVMWDGGMQRVIATAVSDEMLWNPALIVAARNALPRLLEERRRLLEALRVIRSFTSSGLAHEQVDEALAFAEEESK